MTLQGLILRYFAMMETRPDVGALSRFTLAVPPHLLAPFLEWLKGRIDRLEAMGFASSQRMMN